VLGLDAIGFLVARLLPVPGELPLTAMLTPAEQPAMLALRATLCGALAICGGTALLRPAVGAETGPVLPRCTWIAAAAGALGCAAEAATDSGSREWSAALALLLLGAAAGVALARRPRVLAGVAVTGAALAVLTGIELATASIGGLGGLDVAYGISGSVLLGACVHRWAMTSAPRRPSINGAALAERAGLDGRVGVLDLGPAGPGDRSEGTGPSRALVLSRLRGVAVCAAAVVSVVGAIRFGLAGPRTWFDLVHQPSGLVLLGLVVLPLLVAPVWAGIGAAAGLGRTPGHGRFDAAFAAALLAVSVAASLPALPAAAAAPVAGQPLLRPVSLAGRQVSVLVMPMRPGPNLVHLGMAGPSTAASPGMGPAMAGGGMGGDTGVAGGAVTVSAGGAAVAATPRAGAPGLWAVVDIPAGAGALTLAGRGRSAAVPVDVGHAEPTAGDAALERVLAGPDGPECAGAALGALAAGATARQTCPSEGLGAGDAAALSDMVAFLAHQRLTSVALVSDGSPRSRSAAALVRAQATRWGIRIDPVPAGQDSVIVVSGWTGAPAALHEVGRRSALGSTGGAVLAPWLAVAPVLAEASSETVPLAFDPKQRAVREYAATLRAIFPAETPSPGGFLAWAAHRDLPPGPVRFYGAAQVNVPMGGMMDFDMNPAGVPGDWYPGGTVVSIN
jgi:hypothetical protein